MKLLSAVTLSLGLTAGVAQAASVPPAQTPELQRAMARAEQLASRSAATGRAIDRQPPAVTAFNAGTTVNAQRSAATLPVDITISDNLSGLAYVYIEARGPSGQAQILERRFEFASRRNVLSLGMTLSTLAQPGAWQITFVYANDLAGNTVTLGQSALDALGNTRFSVRNQVFDATPPTLLSGRILTPSYTPTQPANGVPDGGPRQSAGVRLRVTDGGGPAIAGVKSAALNFCVPDGFGFCSESFPVFADNTTGQPGLVPSVLVLGEYDEFSFFVPRPGVYVIQSIQLYDFAGNGRSYSNRDLGGDTDFSTLFPSTTIEVLP